MKFIYWSKPLAWVMVLLFAGGTVAAVITLFRKVGRRRQVVGEIAGVKHHEDVRILEVNINTRDRWGGHKAGQFAFVNFGDGEGPHPFTISSQWNDDGCLRFLIKHLGDYTSSLPSRLKAGDLVTVEGPYGRFDFSESIFTGTVHRPSGNRRGGEHDLHASNGSSIFSPRRRVQPAQYRAAQC
jgi:predicted ferric reductase